MLQAEREELSGEPLLRGAREGSGALLEHLDRLQGHRLLNQVLSLHQENVALFEVPFFENGRRTFVPVRVLKRKAGGRGTPDGSSTLTIDADLTRLGRVRAHVEARKRTLSLRFQVRDPGVQALLERSAEELRSALRDAGFESTLRVEVMRTSAESLAFPPARESSYVTLDLQA